MCLGQKQPWFHFFPQGNAPPCPTQCLLHVRPLNVTIECHVPPPPGCIQSVQTGSRSFQTILPATDTSSCPFHPRSRNRHKPICTTPPHADPLSVVLLSRSQNMHQPIQPNPSADRSSSLPTLVLRPGTSRRRRRARDGGPHHRRAGKHQLGPQQ